MYTISTLVLNFAKRMYSAMQLRIIKILFIGTFHDVLTDVKSAAVLPYQLSANIYGLAGMASPKGPGGPGSSHVLGPASIKVY